MVDNPLLSAITQMLLFLSLAAFTGWFMAWLILSSQVRSLGATLAGRRQELTDCRQERVVRLSPEAALLTQHPHEQAAPTLATPGFSAAAPLVTEPAPPPTVAQGSEAAVLSRIAARASELNFDRIGRAAASEADDLQAIQGVGPFLERKLHSLGIYTFRQIANFTKEDIDKVNELIEFFPGRIERDNWVGQSRQFHQQRNG